MRSADDVARDLELDRSSREAEIRLLERYLSGNEIEDEAKALRRCIVVVSYAHFEGFCKFALTAYLSVVNGMSIATEEVSEALLAASMSDVFEALRMNQKSMIFLDRRCRMIRMFIDLPDSKPLFPALSMALRSGRRKYPTKLLMQSQTLTHRC